MGAGEPSPTEGACPRCHTPETGIRSRVPMKDTSDSLADDQAAKFHVRALFISDVHLGTRTARADELLGLLKCCEAEVIYLVGDIIDFWRVRRGPIWPQSHNDVLQKLMRKVRKGTRLVL